MTDAPEHWEAVGRLTATVLHELGNPVAFAVLAATQLARGAKDADEATRSMTAELEESVRRMAELLGELHRATRSAGAASFVDPHALVTGAARLAQAELRGRGSVTIEMEDELPLLPGGASALGAGLAYLLSSVLRGGGGELRVRGRAGDDVVLTIDGSNGSWSPHADDAIRIVSAIAASVGGRAERVGEGTFEVHLPRSK